MYSSLEPSNSTPFASDCSSLLISTNALKAVGGGDSVVVVDDVVHKRSVDLQEKKREKRGKKGEERETNL